MTTAPADAQASDSPEPQTIDAAALRRCLDVLEALVDDRTQLDRLDATSRNRLLAAAGRVAHPGREERRRLSRATSQRRRREAKLSHEAQLATAPIRRLREQPVFVTPPPGLAAPELPETSAAAIELERGQLCYVCKQPYRTLHFFYDQLCPGCGDFNYAKRTQQADLTGRVALVTGARVKIGYQAAIMLLRNGARVIVSTRFPRDAARRYAAETDFDDWKDRLVVYGLDLRHTPSVEAFAAHLRSTEASLDFIVHNACQTVRRPTGFYQHLMEAELTPAAALPEAARRVLAEPSSLGHPHALAPAGVHDAPTLSQLRLAPEDFNAGGHLFPAGELDADQQQIDLRDENSWRLPLDRVGSVELLEVHLVNAVAPFVLNARLKEIMLRRPSRDKHIVNVSAVEGQFYRRHKTDKHPHTNMAKAALNMMTRTSAPDYVRDGIHMNSVDTGWVTDEDPVHIAKRKTRDNGFHPPLDIVDGAARIVDPILDGIRTGEHAWGLFLKDYQSAPW